MAHAGCISARGPFHTLTHHALSYAACRYAKAGKGDKEEWLNFTKDFFLHRDQLVHVLLLIDASLPPQQIDVDCAFWLGECQVRVWLI